ncbi:MAG: BamA/TamA family outer membrane protein [Cyclobacteriaceae bacterium]|nr:BamA/TamA family outer membrane protein [Cyclobacteriaceae bacterium]
MRPKILLNAVLPEQNDIYSRAKHNNSIKQLMSLGSYKYVNIGYELIDQQDSVLHAVFLLTPSLRMSVSSEINATSKSNNFAGPGLKLSYKSRNLFGGAELFSIGFNGSFEKQVKGEGRGDTAYELSIDASLGVPRLVPFKLRKTNTPYLPSTTINIGAGTFARVSLYRFTTLNTGLEYSKRQRIFINHILRPIDISMTKLSMTTPEFEDYLDQNPSIKKSFDEQFIIGFSYNYIINHLTDKDKPQYYINLGFDPSGNLAGLTKRLITGQRNSPDNQIDIFGAPVAQYYRIRGDFRYYFRTGSESLLATRIYGGVGVPYGSSTVMPYIKQFYAGGTNSLRAFRARSLGPGTYSSPDSLRNILVDQTGEIKLEANLEYRFPMVKYLKGSFFADCGNIWLVNADSLRPGGKFDVNRFYKDVAIGIGAGLRIDVEVVVLRLDWAFPIRKPWLPEGDRWTIDKINLVDRKWRKDNLIWNISIGYPF